MSKQAVTLTTIQVPAHLRQFAVEQNYAKYTPIDQAVWRYVLRQNSAFLAEKGFGSYYNGLATTGMSIEKIPNVDEMNARLAEIGWAAVAVDGFIPPVAFFDFQAHGILPIAGDIRTLEHIAYTPAPDIIHESAGHAPMLNEPGYGDFLKVFGEIGAKALSSKEDLDVYEAIRLVSILKEDPTAQEAEVLAAEEALDLALAAATTVSEATMLARLYWWTVEYGLIGTLDDPKLYGAGLLSSMGESRSCIGDHVGKLPFDLEACVQTDFNITKPQPQLFVCEDFEQLIEAVREFEKRMAVTVGGTESLIKALHSANLATMEYSSGLQVSGTLTHLEVDEQGEAIYLQTTGPSALSVGRQELPGHDKSYHEEGFGSPIGLLKDFETPLEEFSDVLLQEVGLVMDAPVELEFASGVIIRGVLREVLRKNGKVVLLKFDDCTVTLAEKVLFRSEWGPFDMAVGQKIVSVYAGAADREAFHVGHSHASKTLTKRPELSEEDRLLNDLFQTVHNLREKGREVKEAEAQDLIQLVLQQADQGFPQDWLLRLELLEIMVGRHLLSQTQACVREQLETLAATDVELAKLIVNGLKLVDVK